MSAPSSLPSGWFTDPHGRYEHRWFNGTAWTADVAHDGQRLVDPLGAAPTPRPGPTATAGNAPATASLTLGLFGLLFAWMPFGVIVGVVLAVLAIVFRVRGRRRAPTVGSGGSMARAGVVVGVAGLLLSVVGIALTADLAGAFNDFTRPGAYDTSVEECVIEGQTISVAGAITNRSRTLRDYTVYAVVEDPDGIDDLVQSVSDVAPGETRVVAWRDSTTRGGDCTVRLVAHGPLPYGLPMERTRG